MSDAPSKMRTVGEAQGAPTSSGDESQKRISAADRVSTPDGVSAPDTDRPPRNAEASMPSPEPTPKPRRRRSLRSLLLPAAALAAVLVILAGIAYWRANLGIIKTDNAQTAGDLAPISARVSGIVVKLDVQENDHVAAGAVLLELDPTDYRLAVDQANAALATAQAQVQVAQAALLAQQRQYAAGVSSARGTLQAARPNLPEAQAQLRMAQGTTTAQVAAARDAVTTASANIQSTKAALDTANSNLSRDRELFDEGAIPAQQIDIDTAAYAKAKADYLAAQDGLREAQSNLAAAQANMERVTISQQGVAASSGQIAQARAQVQQAAAGEATVAQRVQELAAARAEAAQAAVAVQAAKTNLSYTVVRAPVAGWVTNRTVEIGQVVDPNQPLMAITEQNRIWVVANIKETLLGRVRPGDPVRITVDVYRGQIFHGHVESIGSATGSSTALLPPDNATGNFIKVVQLVPVRITLDPGTDPTRELQVGLSAEVAIDTRAGAH
jgi:membrane fusion protein, multidrug efflux system